jgi:hypothetical protein
MTYRHRTFAAAVALMALVAPALADDVIRPTGAPLVIQGAVGALIQSPTAIGKVFVGDPAIADVQVPAVDSRFVYVFGKKAGTTAVYALDQNGDIAISRLVTVSGPKTVRVMRGGDTHIWSEAHGEATESKSINPEPTLNDLPKGSAVTIPVGSK